METFTPWTLVILYKETQQPAPCALSQHLDNHTLQPFNLSFHELKKKIVFASVVLVSKKGSGPLKRSKSTLDKCVYVQILYIDRWMDRQTDR